MDPDFDNYIQTDNVYMVSGNTKHLDSHLPV